MKKLFITTGIIALALITFIGVVVLVQIDFSNDEDLDVFITTKMKSFQGVGMAVAFLRAGEITWSNNYGYEDREAGKMVTDDTIFHIASSRGILKLIAMANVTTTWIVYWFICLNSSERIGCW